jgi:anti-anti-sigma factor
MTGSPTPFEIREHEVDGFKRLSLTGELDMMSTPVLDNRLASLRASRSPVQLDLSKLEFIDSTGLHLLVRTVGEARLKGWELQIDPDVSPAVRSAFRLVRLDRFIAGNG